jgi:SAM-dependent MidA family methyltransferase
MERLDAFMARANAAYYATRDPFSDFTTAPEISQVFGELLGLWAAVVWQAMGMPAPVALAEAGPGRGTLMSDALRAIRRTMPHFAAALRVHLIETSPRLRAVQARAVAAADWHDSLDAVPPGPLLFIANEFLDALPIRQFVRRGAGWRERFVEGAAFVEVPVATGPAIDAPDGAVAETCETALAFARTLAGKIMAGGGAALLIDYGQATAGFGDSLQALRDGVPVDPLTADGDTDLTAHVDFPALATAASGLGAVVHGPVPQGVFLARLGLFQRVDRLASGKSPAQAVALVEAARRLAEPDRMGRLFKAMAICHPDLPCPPGFAE